MASGAGESCLLWEGAGLWMGWADSQLHWGWDSCHPELTTLFSAAGPVPTFSIVQGEARPATWAQGTGRQMELLGTLAPVCCAAGPSMWEGWGAGQGWGGVGALTAEALAERM